MSKITVTSNIKPGELRKWATDITEKSAERVVRRLAEMCEVSIKTEIMNSSKMPTGALADAFFKIQFSRYHWGVGDIDYLNDATPYWRHINYGSEAIGANWEHILPMGHWEDGRWVEGDGDDNFFAVPNTRIQAHNYIERTIVDMHTAINRVISEG